MIECLLMNASEIINFSLLFWLHWVFVVARRSFSSCSARASLGKRGFSGCDARAVVHRLSCCSALASLPVLSRRGCPQACGVLVPLPGMEPRSPALEG